MKYLPLIAAAVIALTGCKTTTPPGGAGDPNALSQALDRGATSISLTTAQVEAAAIETARIAPAIINTTSGLFQTGVELIKQTLNALWDTRKVFSKSADTNTVKKVSLPLSETPERMTLRGEEVETAGFVASTSEGK